jgi:hypothetical protein
MSNSFVIDRDSNFKSERISTLPSSGNNVSVERGSNMGFSGNVQNSSSPKLFPGMLSNSPKNIPRPNLSNKSVPMDSFFGLANSKKASPSLSSSSSVEDSDEDDDDDESDYKQSIQQSSSPSKNRYESSVEDDSSSDGESDDDFSSRSGSSGTEDSGSEYESSRGGSENSVSKSENFYHESPRKSYEEIQREKQQVLYELDRLQKQGYPASKKYSMASTLEDMIYERDKLKKQRNTEKSIKFSRKALIMVTSGIEFLNSKFDPFDLKLEGWGEQVMEDITDYDEIFEELHDKYGESIKTAPELRLLLTLGGSAAMFHLQNSLFKSATPDLNDILKKNPDIMKSIQQRALQEMQSNISNQFGRNDEIGNMMNQGIQMKMNNQTQPPRSNIPMSPMGPPRPIQTQQRPMNPPQAQRQMNDNVVNDLLNQLNTGMNKSKDDDSISSRSSHSGVKSIRRKKNNRGIVLDLA